jgi:hypothetical protein
LLQAYDADRIHAQIKAQFKTLTRWPETDIGPPLWVLQTSPFDYGALD